MRINVKKISVSIFLCLIIDGININYLYAQTQCVVSDYLTSGHCHVNVNDNDFDGYKHVARSVFKFADITGCGDCTGMLINRSVVNSQLLSEQCFITAWHCLSGEGITIGSVFQRQLIFNYQSFNNIGINVPLGNQGGVNGQSINNTNSEGYRYYLEANIKLVEKVSGALGDFAICYILTPIPAHFKVYYAGWNPINSMFVASSPPYVGIHHPSGDIKKISATFAIIVPPSNPVAITCKTITKTVDAVFGWLWGRDGLTQVICNYVETPETNFYYIPYWTAGTTEGGSSGSPLFGALNKSIGTLTAGSATCSFHAIDQYNRLGKNYLYPKVKQTMNPSNNFWIDQFGMSGKDILCYDNLSLNGFYYPARDYQLENIIYLSASNNITTNGFLRIFEGADFVFRAGNTIELNNGFDVDQGANFDTQIGGCAHFSKLAFEGNFSQGSEFLWEIASIKIPEEMEFDIDKYTNKNITLKAYPNPTEGILHLLIQSETPESVAISIRDMKGRQVYAVNLDESAINIENTISLESFSNGMYQIEAITQSGFRTVSRVVLEK